MKIRTSYDYPPIPDRRFDWSAVDDNYDIGDAIGRGSTEFEAILDLLKQLDEKRVGWPDMLNYTSSPLTAARDRGQSPTRTPLLGLPSPTSHVTHGATPCDGVGMGTESTKGIPASLFQWCVSCRRLLWVGERFSDGFTDNVLFCHRCQRRDAEFDTLLRDAMREDARLGAYYAAEETISGREDTEEIR